MNRRFLMSHRTDAAFLSYQSQKSTVDFIALFREIEPRKLSPQIGISVNRDPTAPLVLSDPGRKAVQDDDDVQAAKNDMESLRTAIKEKHKSLAAAARSSDRLVEERVLTGEQLKLWKKTEKYNHLIEVCSWKASLASQYLPEQTFVLVLYTKMWVCGF